MANQDVRVSALQSASTLSTEDLALATVVDELSETGYTSKKITEGAKASQYMEAFTFANLNTSAKTIVGAINEAATTGGSDEFIIHMTDTTVTETAADIIDAFDNGSEIWLESQITGEALKARLPLLAYISDSNSLVLRFSGITYSNNRYRYCDVQMIRSPEQILGKQAINVTFAVIDDATTSSSSVWSSQKTASELAGKAEIDDTAIDTDTTWSSSRIVSLLPTESASGAVASFETPLTLPLVSHNVTIEPVQSGTGDPSPSNVRPISGWNAVNVTKTGKNLANIKPFSQWDSLGNSYKVMPLGLPKNQRVIMSFKDKDTTIDISDINLGFVNSDASLPLQTDQFRWVIASSGTIQSITTNVPTNNDQTIFLDSLIIYPNTETAYNKVFSRYDIQIELGTTSTTYEAYNGNTYEIDLDGTVYGGELNVTNGVLRVTHKSIVLDGSENWGNLTSSHFALLTLEDNYTRNTTANLCDKFKIQGIVGWANVENLCVGFLISSSSTLNNIALRNDDWQTTQDLKDWLSSNNTRLVYELATPVEITLTPEQINTLKGVNNIWADTGDTAVEYKQDIQTYIDSRLLSGTRSLSLAKAPVETKEETKQEEQEGDENVNR